MRVHELAKELELSSKELLAKLKDFRVEVKNHMSALDDDQVAQVRASLGSAPATTPSARAPEPAVATETQPSASVETATATLEPEEVPGETASRPTPATPAEEEEATPAADKGPKTITVRGAIIVKDFAEHLGLRPNQLIAELMKMNVFASINERIDLKIAQQVAQRQGFLLEHEKKQVEHKPLIRKEKPAEPDEDRPEDLAIRPPVVAFLGHVDHGKTSLLDKIRQTRVADGEDGGITQHIGAYTVEFQDHSITFLDTPGHEAFTAMRARGANLTDIVVLVVAADDGIMPQTREAIQHAKAADVAIIVAINKMDLPGADPDRIKQQLQQEGLTVEDWGGDIVCCEVSAATGDGIGHLLEMIVLQSELLELAANPKRKAQGFVIEARLEPGMGPTATVLVRRGTLLVGDAMTCGSCWGRIKSLINDQGVRVRTAGPSMAVKCLGLTDVPAAGAEFKVLANDRQARQEAEEAQAVRRSESLATAPKRASLDDLFASANREGALELNVILKTDVHGSLEAIVESMEAIESEKVSVKFLLVGVGNITENDVLLASASNAIILGFHVSIENRATAAAKREGVEIRLYSVIYEMLDQVREAMTGLLAPEKREKVIGHAEIRQVFEVSKSGRIAGCMVTNGIAKAKAKARVKRGNEIIYEGSLASLRRFQNDAASVRDGQECGIRLDNFADFEVQDVIEIYELEEIAQQL